MPGDMGADFASSPEVEPDPFSSEYASDAIAPLANLPLFFKLAGKRALVAGGSEAAAWKAELLAAAGAEVDVFAPEPSRKLLEIAARRGAVRIARRRWRPEDFAGAAIAVGDLPDPAEASAFRSAGRAAGAPVNVVDQPEFCDFSFGAIVNRSPLVIGVSTDGAAPVFGQALRGRLETLIPQGFAAWAAAAESWRDSIQTLGASFRRRRNFWERFAALALAKADRRPSEADRETLIAAARDGASRPEDAEAYFIGAGSDGAESMTLKAWRALQSADAIIFDAGVPPEILDLARREADRVPADGGDVAGAIVALCGAGKKVVRLHDSASAPPGRSDAEITAARRAGIACVVIPALPGGAPASERRP